MKPKWWSTRLESTQKVSGRFPCSNLHSTCEWWTNWVYCPS